MQARYYQDEAVSSVVSATKGFSPFKNVNPVVVLPTGAGKTIVIRDLIKQFFKLQGGQVLVLSHNKEILKQNYKAIKDSIEETVTLYSSGLGIKDYSGDVVVAGIQSIYKKTDLFCDVGLIIIDECHLVNPKSNGMYRDFTKHVQFARIVGLTATNYRLGDGYITDGNDPLFTETVYDLSETEKFNRLVNEGYLSKLLAKNTDKRLDVSNIKTIAGDFSDKDMSMKLDTVEINSTIVKEIIKYGKNYKKWLVFAIDIQHAENITKLFSVNGIKAAVMHSKVDPVKAESDLKAFKQGDIRAMINVNMLTTGYDDPEIDLIAMLRPTKSPVLHVQSIGRGLRTAKDKDHCLVLDFAGNVQRIGPINAVHVKKKGEGKGKGRDMAKECQHCSVVNHLSAKVCINCEEPFPIKNKLTTAAYSGNITKSSITEDNSAWLPVVDVAYAIHQKLGRPSSLKVSYRTGLRTVSQWICLDHKGYAKNIALNWVKNNKPDDLPFPKNVNELYKQSVLYRKPVQIKVDFTGRYPEIKGLKFA